jgi:hypothetical protein
VGCTDQLRRAPIALFWLVCANACLFEWDGYDPRNSPPGSPPQESCEPAATESCYAGPDGTEGVGACVAGLRTCNDAGTGFGACAGEVAPTVELCATPEDDDCDGEAVEADCSCVTNETFTCYEGAPATEGVGACTSGTQQCGADGTPAGPCIGQTTPLHETCESNWDDDCDGVTNDWCGAWVQRFGASSNQQARAFALRDGVIVVGATVEASIDFGGGSETSAGLTDWVVAALNSNDGSERWTTRVGGLGADSVWAAAIDAAGDVYVAGEFEGTLTLGATVFVATGIDALLLKLDGTDGSVMGTYHVAGSGNAHGRGVAVDAMGNVAFSGHFEGSVELAPAVLTAAQSTDGFIIMVDAGGGHRWSTDIGEGGADRANSVAIDTDDNVIVVGEFDNEIDIGGVSITNVSGQDAYVLKFDAQGNHVFTTALAGVDNEVAVDVTTDSQGDIYVVGFFDTDIDLGAGPMTSVEGDDAFVTKLSAAGAPLWGVTMGGPTEQDASAVSLGASGEVIVSVSMETNMQFGSELLLGAGQDDMAVALFDNDGNPMFARRFGDHDDQDMWFSAMDADGSLIVAGDCQSVVTFAEGVSTAGPTGNEDICLARLVQ